MSSINYVQYVSWKRELLYEWIEPNEEVLFCKNVEHDDFFVDFITKCSLKEIKEQVNYILDWSYQMELFD